MEMGAHDDHGMQAHRVKFQRSAQAAGEDLVQLATGPEQVAAMDGTDGDFDQAARSR